MESSEQNTVSLDRDILDTPKVRVDQGHLVRKPVPTGMTVPTLVADLGDYAAKRFLEFFTANIRN